MDSKNGKALKTHVYGLSKGLYSSSLDLATGESLTAEVLSVYPEIKDETIQIRLSVEDFCERR